MHARGVCSGSNGLGCGVGVWCASDMRARTCTRALVGHNVERNRAEHQGRAGVCAVGSPHLGAGSGCCEDRNPHQSTPALLARAVHGWGHVAVPMTQPKLFYAMVLAMLRAMLPAKGAVALE